VLYSPDTKVPR
nr:RecName: Full=Thylakoid lumenal 33.6 kDa protein [Spinacia oleracea]